LLAAFEAPHNEPNAGSRSIPERHRRAGMRFHDDRFSVSPSGSGWLVSSLRPHPKVGNNSARLICHNVCMTDERSLTLRQVDQARGDLYGIADDLEFIKEQLARLPTRKEMAQTALLVTLTTAALVLAGFEALFR
jgi:hypothetical protein